MLNEAMTPAFKGLMATMLPGVRPSISFAPVPTASTRPVTLLTATMEGSLTTIPRPFGKTTVWAVPRSMARSVERNDSSEPKPIFDKTMHPGLLGLGDANSVFARFFYLVHRHIGCSHQFFSGSRHVGQRGHSDRCREPDLQSASFEERMHAQSLADAVSHRRRTLRTGVRQHDCKLVATKPGDDVGFTRAATNHNGGFHERPASGLLPLCIVDYP